MTITTDYPFQGQDQLIGFYVVVMPVSVAGLFAGLVMLNPLDLLRPVILSCAVIAIAAFPDADANNLTRSAQLYVMYATNRHRARYSRYLDQLDAQVILYQVLGGGWEDSAEPG